MDGVPYGFMLVSPQGATKQLLIQEVAGPDAARISGSSAATHQDYDPKYDTPYSQDSFSTGLGQLDFDGMDEKAVWWAPGIVTHVDNKAYLAPSVNTLSLPSATGDIGGFYAYLDPATGVQYDFCWSGSRLYRRTASNRTNAWSAVYTHGTGGTVSSFVIFNGVGVIAVADTADTTDFITATTPTGTLSLTGRNHTPFSAALGKPKYFCMVRGTLYAAVDNHKVFFTVDPTTDGWIGPVAVSTTNTAPNVGTSTYAFTNLYAVNDYLLAFKQDAGYNIDSQQNALEVLWQWKEKPSTYNFRHLGASSNVLLFSAANEVYAYDPQVGSQPPLGLSRQAGFSTQSILGVGGDNQYAYVLARVRVPTINAADSVCLFRLWRIRGNQWGIECLWQDTTITETYWNLTAVPFASGTRLYWGVTSGGATSTNVMDIPADWDETTTAAYQTSGVLYTSISRALFPGFYKRHLWLAYETEGTTDSSHKIAAAYSVNNGVTWTALGDTGSGGAGILSTQHNYTNINSKSIALRFTFTGGGTQTPVLRVYDHHQRVRFRYLPLITASVRVADQVELNTRTRDRRSKEEIAQAIETLRTTRSAVLYEDFLGNSFTCTIDQVGFSPSRHNIANIDKNTWEQEATLVISQADAGA